ncbi:MAG: hypothetical protein AB7O84_12955 [Planctomycetota bacterium]
MLRNALITALASSAIASLPAQCFDTNLGTDLLLSDDGVAAALPLGFTFNFGGVAYTDICVCSNGYIWLGPVSSGGDFSPTVPELLSGAPRICPLWIDLNPASAGSGHVYYNTIPGVSATVSWAHVHQFGSTTPFEMQMVLDVTGTVTVTWGANAPIGGSLGPAVICGASPGGGAVANPVSFGAPPVISLSDTFHEEALTPGPFPQFSNRQMIWAPTTPGYVCANNACSMNSLPLPAKAELVGAGCPAVQGPSLYEVFSTTNPPDLNGLDLGFLPTSATDYLALPGLSSTYFAGGTNNLGLTDDQAVSVALPFSFPYGGGTISSIWVSSNGFITLGAVSPGSGCCTGLETTLASGDPRICAWWADLNPNAGGTVTADLDGTTGEFVVSWNAVPEFGQTNTVDTQIALAPTGQFTIRWQNVTNTSHTWIAGYSQGGGVPVIGSADLSSVTSTPVTSVVQTPLTQSFVGTPQIGGSFQIDVNNIAPLPNGNICVLLLSTEFPGGLGLGFLGATGCTGYLVLPELASFLNLSLGAPTSTFTFPIPAAPSFQGVQLMSQAISDDVTANAFGWRISNGVRWTFGL